MATSPNTTAPVVTRRDQNRVSTLTLNRPDAYNALSIEVMESMLLHLDALNRDPDIAVIVIEGSGKGFCAGHDLKEMRANPTAEFREKTFGTCSQMMMAITHQRQPVIAKVHGIATAAGCQLVATCDLAVASDDARFGTPGVNIGLFCSTPMVALSRAVSKKHAMEMLLTGDLVDARQAVSMGLINKAVAGDRLESETKGLAEKVASKSGLVLKTGKEAYYRQIENSLQGAYDYCARVMVENMGYRDAEEGIAAFIEKRDPVWTEE